MQFGLSIEMFLFVDALSGLWPSHPPPPGPIFGHLIKPFSAPSYFQYRLYTKWPLSLVIAIFCCRQYVSYIHKLDIHGIVQLRNVGSCLILEGFLPQVL